MRTIIRDNYDPQPGDYHERIVIDEARGKSWLFDCDGVFLPYNDVEVMNEKGESTTKAISQKLFTDEINRLDAEDTSIWNEIETIEAASDVVDVVGTYAELESYDTSKLHDKDLIKVLQDETKDDAITYYRWSTSTHTFSYVGEEGPYYTQSQVDTKLGGKQDTLIAGTNISIAADGKTISATDTTYSNFTGATASVDGAQGLVPGPLAGDQDKVLKGDGTWGDAAANTIFYMNSSESGGTRHIYKNPDMTGAATSQEVFDANERGQVILRISTSVTPDQYSDAYLQNAYKATGDYQLLFLDEKTYRSFDTTTLSADTFTYSARVLQDQLTAGTNITITGATISAPTLVGATSSANGTAGVAPQPLKADRKKFLKGDGTWAETTAEYTIDDVDIMDPSVSSVTLSSGTWGNVFADFQTGAKNVHIMCYWHNDPHWNPNYCFYSVVDTIEDQTAYGVYVDKLVLAAPDGGVVLVTLPTPDSATAAVTHITPITSLPTANATTAGIAKLYTTTGQNTDGSVTQKLFTDTVGNIESALQILNSGAGVP